MDIFFQDPSEIPLPPEEVRIRELRAEPWPDGQRVHVYLEVDPFQKRPNAEVSITNQLDEEVASVSIIQSMDRRMEFTMHLRGLKAQGRHMVTATLFYSELPPQAGEASEEGPAGQTMTLVDKAQTTFEIQQVEG